LADEMVEKKVASLVEIQAAQWGVAMEATLAVMWVVMMAGLKAAVKVDEKVECLV
jgi:predicted metal-binding membrane protein